MSGVKNAETHLSHYKNVCAEWNSIICENNGVCTSEEFPLIDELSEIYNHLSDAEKIEADNYLISVIGQSENV